MQTVIKNVIMQSAMVNNKLMYSFTNANIQIDGPKEKNSPKKLSTKKLS